MARTVRDSKIESRNARLKLAPSHRAYFRAIDAGLHIGYRRSARGGKWLARWYCGRGKYEVQHLGIADDVIDPDGAIVLSFAQAQAQARKLYIEAKRRAAGLREADQCYRVRDCLEDYLEWLERHRKSVADARYRIFANILPTLGNIPCTALTTKQVEDWHHQLATLPAKLRSRTGGSRNHRSFDPTDPEATRRRRSTANRNLTVLKAALNRAWREGKTENDAPWRRVRPFSKVRPLAHDTCRSTSARGWSTLAMRIFASWCRPRCLQAPDTVS